MSLTVNSELDRLMRQIPEFKGLKPDLSTKTVVAPTRPPVIAGQDHGRVLRAPQK